MTTRPFFLLSLPKAMLLIALLGWLAYVNSFTKAFHLDDILWILSNDDLPNWGMNVIRHLQRPLVALSLTVNYKLGGIEPAGYHVVNLAIHIGAGLALFGLVRRTLLLPRWQHAYDDVALALAFATAALWTVHPLNTHAVTYIIQRCESGMGLCYVFSLYALLRGAQAARPALWYGAAVLAAWLGIGCKEVMVTIIPVALLFDRVFLADSWGETLRRRSAVYLGLVSILALPLRSHLQNLLMVDEIDGMSAGFAIPNLDAKTYFLTQLTVLPYYLRLTVWPVALCFDYRDWPLPSAPLEYLPGGVGLTIAFLACICGLFRRNGFAFLGMSAFLVLSLTSSFLPLLDVANEYRMYVPLMALIAGLVIGGYLLLSRLCPPFARQSALQAAVLAPIAVALIVLTEQRNEDYSTERTIWEDVLAKRPKNYKAYHHLGVAHDADGNWAESEKNYRLNLQYQPDHFLSLANLGLISYRDGRTKEGLDYLDRAVKKNNTNSDSTTLLATFRHLEGESQAALASLYFAIRLDPYKALPRFHFAGVLHDVGLVKQARAEFEDAVRRFPDWPSRFQKYARARLRGRFGDKPTVRREALFYATIAAAAAPHKTAEILTTLADAYAWNGRYADAVIAVREAMELTPDQPPDVRLNLENKLRALEAK